jgi:hypothetical protein
VRETTANYRRNVTARPPVEESNRITSPDQKSSSTERVSRYRLRPQTGLSNMLPCDTMKLVLFARSRFLSSNFGGLESLNEHKHVWCCFGSFLRNVTFNRSVQVDHPPSRPCNVSSHSQFVHVLFPKIYVRSLTLLLLHSISDVRVRLKQ